MSSDYGMVTAKDRRENANSAGTAIGRREEREFAELLDPGAPRAELENALQHDRDPVRAFDRAIAGQPDTEACWAEFDRRAKLTYAREYLDAMNADVRLV